MVFAQYVWHPTLELPIDVTSHWLVLTMSLLHRPQAAPAMLMAIIICIWY